MTALKISEINEGATYSAPVYLDSQFLLLDEMQPFSASLKRFLVEWGFKEVLTEGEPQERLRKSMPKAKPALNASSFETVDINAVFNDEEEPKDRTAIETNQQLAEVIEKAQKEIAALSEYDIEGKIAVSGNVYNSFKDYISKIYTRFVTHRELKIGLLSEAVQILCDFMKNNRKYLLQINPLPGDKIDKNFIVNHSLRSTIYALTIGQNLRMPNLKLVELGVAALLHEIGQIRLPPQLYLTDRRLLPNERQVLMTHTILGYNILKENGFPLSIQVGVFEHHERENGKGYPRKISGNQISLYGKILSVVCSFEAISAPRHYKEMKSTHEAMIEMLKNQDKQYDDTVIKALVQSVSLFPIGGYVFLANGKVAQVVDTNGIDPRMPIVQILGERDANGFPRTIQTNSDKFKIIRALTKNEIASVLKALKK